MRRKVLIGIIILSLIASIVVTVGRYRLEQSNRNVEIVLDWLSFDQFQKVTKKSPLELLQIMKTEGVSAVALYEKRLSDYERSKDLVLMHGSELAREFYITGRINPVLEGLYQGTEDLDNLYLLFKDYEIYQRLYSLLQPLPNAIINGTQEDDARGFYVIELENGDTKIESTYLGFRDEEVELVTKAGLQIVPRISNNTKRLTIIPQILDQVQSQGQVNTMIFSGTQVIGYPDHLETTAEMLEERNIQIGMIEPFLAYQLGIRELAPKINMDMVRVHSIQQKEVEKYSFEKTLDRYIRAVKERNVRLLYFKPFLEPKGDEKPLELTQRFLRDLRTELEKNGYQIGVAQPFSNERTGIIWILLISLGVMAAGLLLIEQFIGLPTWLEGVLFVLGVLAVSGLTFKGYVLLTRDLMALLASSIFPGLGIIIGYRLAEKGVKEKKISTVLGIFLITTAITLIGILYLIGLLSDVRYMYQINQFRGIKLSFLLPLMVVGLYYLKRILLEGNLKSSWVKLREILNQPVRYSHLVLFGLLGVAGLIYIGRTGNNPILPVPDIEMQVRALLEDILVYRPRFKEIALGHPFLILAIYYLIQGKGKGKLTLPLILIGTIGQLNIFNTFAHIHTPLVPSIVRTLTGVLLGIINGLILVWLYQSFIKLWKKYGRYIYE